MNFVMMNVVFAKNMFAILVVVILEFICFANLVYFIKYFAFALPMNKFK